MITLLMLLFACGEEKADDSACVCPEEQQEQQDVPVEDTGEEPVEEPAEDTAAAE
jgi:hypothetical protein